MKKDQPTVDDDGQPLPPKITGVEVRLLTVHPDHRGELNPFIDLHDDFWFESVVYGYRFSIRPGRIKGWGMHRKQTDRYLIVTGSVRIVLYDGVSFDQFWFTQPALLSIPANVWHADQNWGDTDAHICNFPTVPYNPSDPDKYRISPDSDEIPFDWTLRDG